MNSAKNVRIYATSRYERDGINVYGDFSGHRVYLVRYRYSWDLYKYLKRGVPLEALRLRSRSHSDQRSEQALAHSLKQITRILEDYIQFEKD